MNIKNLIPLYESVLTNESYNEDFYKKQIARLKSQAGHYVTPEQIRKKIKRFGDLKSNFRTANQLEKKIKDALAQGRKPENQRQGAFIAPETKYRLEPDELETIKNADPKQLSPEALRAYKQYQAELQRIDQIDKRPLEVRNFNWNDLEAIVDQFPDPEEKQALKKASQSAGGIGSAKMIYDQNNLQVYFGADGNECFLIKVNAMKRRGIRVDPNTYKWCISADPTGSGNLHLKYRFGQYGASVAKSSYFVYDEDKPTEDKWHFFVIHVGESTPSGAKGPYMVTSALNDGDPWWSWEQVEQIQPKLKGLQDLFQFVPLSEEEQIIQTTAGDANANTFKTFTSYRVKRVYIKLGKKVYAEDYVKLDPVLQHLYINTRSPNAEDPDKTAMLRKLLLLFQDSRHKEDMSERISKATDIGRKTGPNDLSFIDALTDDPAMKQSKDPQTFKRWRQLLIDVIKGINSAAKAAVQRKAAQ